MVSRSQPDTPQPDTREQIRPAARPVEELELIGGALCLDFANTIGGSRADPREYLIDYAALVRWSERLGALQPEDARALLAEAEDRPAEAAGALARARELRDRIYRVYAALARGRPAVRGDLQALNESLAPVLAELRLVANEDGYSWRPVRRKGALDIMLGPVARDAADLLVSGDLERVKQCGGEDCDWLFLDVSRNRSRRWCDMKDCGNRAKARRHYRRQKRGRQTRGAP